MAGRKRTYNTFDAHRLLHWAGEIAGVDAQLRLKRALLTAYFTDGLDPSDPQHQLAATVAGGTVTFTSATAGTKTFTYRAVDAGGLVSANTATVTVTVAASEQCGRNRVPVIHAAVGLTEWLAKPSSDGLRCVLSLAQGTRALAEVAAGAEPLVVLSGPEGGLSPAEEALALGAGFAPVTLGPRVLRAETAPLAVLAALTV